MSALTPAQLAAKRDALATARMRVAEETAALETLARLGHVDSSDYRFAVRELAHQRAIVARLETLLAE